jgi:hypothetical protein
MSETIVFVEHIKSTTAEIIGIVEENSVIANPTQTSQTESYDEPIVKNIVEYTKPSIDPDIIQIEKTQLMSAEDIIDQFLPFLTKEKFLDLINTNRYYTISCRIYLSKIKLLKFMAEIMNKKFSKLLEINKSSDVHTTYTALMKIKNIVFAFDANKYINDLEISRVNTKYISEFEKIRSDEMSARLYCMTEMFGVSVLKYFKIKLIHESEYLAYSYKNKKIYYFDTCKKLLGGYDKLIKKFDHYYMLCSVLNFHQKSLSGLNLELKYSEIDYLYNLSL